MSNWIHIAGIITVCPFGRTQAEKQYILDTVLAHLPKVTGDEEDMNVYTIKRKGYNSTSNVDEFDNFSNLGNKYLNSYIFKTQDYYNVIVDGDLRGRLLNDTIKEFNNWLCRLAKRLYVNDVIVKITEDFTEKEIIINNNTKCYSYMFEDPSWISNGKSYNWCEFLMFDLDKYNKKFV